MVTDANLIFMFFRRVNASEIKFRSMHNGDFYEKDRRLKYDDRLCVNIVLCGSITPAGYRDTGHPIGACQLSYTFGVVPIGETGRFYDKFGPDFSGSLFVRKFFHAALQYVRRAFQLLLHVSLQKERAVFAGGCQHSRGRDT